MPIGESVRQQFQFHLIEECNCGFGCKYYETSDKSASQFLPKCFGRCNAKCFCNCLRNKYANRTGTVYIHGTEAFFVMKDNQIVNMGLFKN